MPINPAPAVTPTQRSPLASAADRGAAVGAEAIPSAYLLSGRTSVTIDHEGTLYVLRATRAGKLILTK